jgi:predicted PurR-regulated permease PerM
MGRSRRRARLAAASPSSPAGADAKAQRAAARARTRPAAQPAPPELRKVLGAYLAGAILLAVLVLIGTLTLAGTLAPFLVLAVDAAAAYALYRWAQSRLAGLHLTDEDRVLQTLAGGLLVVVLAFAAVAAAVLTVVS